jgi:hypothetical protein
MIYKRNRYKKKELISIIVFVCIVFFAIFYFQNVNYLLTDLKEKIAKSIELSRVTNINSYSFNSMFSFIAKIPKETLKGRFPADIDDIRLHIKQKHLKKTNAERRKAIANRILFDQNKYPLIVENKNEFKKGKFRLKGDLSDHWQEKSRWSLRIKLKKGLYINGMREFSIQKPVSRSFPYDYVFQSFIRNMGNLSPSFDFFRTYVNGEDWGVMLAEEHISQELLEKQGKKVSVLLRMNDQSGWVYNSVNKARKIEVLHPQKFNLPIFDFYEENKLSLSEKEMFYASYIVDRVKDVLYGKIKATSIFDVDSYSNAFLTAVAWQSLHSLHHSNSKLYFNPYSLRLEIVTTDAGPYKPWNPKGKRSPLNTEDMNTRGYPVFSRLIADNLFINKGVQKNKNKLYEAFNRAEVETTQMMKKFPLESSMFRFDRKLIVGNINKTNNNRFENLRNELKLQISKPIKMNRVEHVLTDKVFLPKHIEAEYYRSGKLVIHNLLTSAVTIERIVHYSSNNGIDLIKEDIAISPGDDSVSGNSIELILSKRIVDSKNPLIIHSRVGLDVKIMQINLSYFDHTFNPMIDNPNLITAKQLPKFVSLKGDQLIIRQGVWRVASPLIIPSGFKLTIEKGTTLLFSPNAYVLSMGPVSMKGTQEEQIVLKPSEKFWKGVYIIEAGAKSEIENAVFSETTFFHDGILSLTGGVNFYKSPVIMKNVSFIGSLAEDQLNIVHSTIKLQDLEFTNSRSDAFDCDYCRGSIEKVKFTNIGGDALDTSGSEISITDFTAQNIFDKAISGGEISRLRIRNVFVQNAGVAIAVKDGSNIKLSNIDVKEITVSPVMVYTKKPSYSSATLIIEEDSLFPEDILVQEGNFCILNGYKVQSRYVDVESLYQSGSMKK